MTMQRLLCLLIGSLFISLPTQAQIGRRLPSERKVVPDSVTGVPLTFLTSTAGRGQEDVSHPSPVDR